MFKKAFALFFLVLFSSGFLAADVILSDIKGEPFYDPNGNVFNNDVKVSYTIINLGSPMSVDLEYNVSKEGIPLIYNCKRNIANVSDKASGEFYVGESRVSDGCTGAINVSDPKQFMFAHVFASPGVYVLSGNVIAGGDAKIFNNSKADSFSVSEDIGIAIPDFPFWLAGFLPFLIWFYRNKRLSVH